MTGQQQPLAPQWALVWHMSSLVTAAGSTICVADQAYLHCAPHSSAWKLEWESEEASHHLHVGISELLGYLGVIKVGTCNAS